jgi:stearoyl-CoA desaturase (delta-9 desaturase)
LPARSGPGTEQYELTERSPGGAAAGKRRSGSWLRPVPFLRSRLQADHPQINVMQPAKTDWLREPPFLLVSLTMAGVLWVGASPVVVITALGSYFLRIFAVIAFSHGYFSHRSFQTMRTVQFAFALAGASAAQRGPLKSPHLLSKVELQ